MEPTDEVVPEPAAGQGFIVAGAPEPESGLEHTVEVVPEGEAAPGVIDGGVPEPARSH